MTRSRNLALGVMLIAVGLLFLLDAIGVPVLEHLWRAWPLVLVAFGGLQLDLRRRGLPWHLRSPERLLIGLVTLGGVIVTLAQERPPGPRPSDGRAAGSAPAPVEKWREDEKHTAQLSPGQELRVEVSGADLEIGPGGSATLVATVSSARRAAPAESRLRVKEDGGEREVSFHAPEPSGGARPRVRLLLPDATRLVIEHGDGRLEVRDVGALELAANGSDVVIERVQGSAELRVENGTLDLRGASGSVEIKAQSTSVRATGLAAGVTVHSSYGNLHLRGVGGSADVTASDGVLTLEGIAGNAEVHCLRCALEVRGVQGSLEVTAAEGPITAEAVAGNLTVDARASRVTAQGVTGSAAVTTTLHDVSLSSIQSGVIVRVEDGDAVVRDCHGRVDVKVTHGEVKLERAHQGGDVRVEDGAALIEVGHAPFQVDAARANVTLALHRTGARLALAASPGAIESRLGAPLPIESTGGRATLEASVRNGGAPVTVEVRQGVIRLEE